jgi:ribosomal protein L21
MTFAIIETGGKQYRVSEGSAIKVEKLSNVKEGATVTFDKVLLTDDGAKTVVGAPYITDAKVTGEVIEAVGKIRDGAGRYAPMVVTHTPLLKGVNDSAETLWELFGKLFENNIKPYYLLHTMPHTPYANQQRISVRDGIRLMNKLKRHKSNIAIPEYVIVHYDGKQTVPLELGGTPEFQYCLDFDNNPIVKLLNWKGTWVNYPDCQDTIK